MPSLCKLNFDKIYLLRITVFIIYLIRCEFSRNWSCGSIWRITHCESSVSYNHAKLISSCAAVNTNIANSSLVNTERCHAIVSLSEFVSVIIAYNQPVIVIPEATRWRIAIDSAS